MNVKVAPKLIFESENFSEPNIFCIFVTISSNYVATGDGGSGDGDGDVPDSAGFGHTKSFIFSLQNGLIFSDSRICGGRSLASGLQN